MLHAGSCHCGAIEIRVDAPSKIDAYECNCSMCERTGFLHLIVPKSGFTLAKDDDALVEYTFNTKVAKTLFLQNVRLQTILYPEIKPGWL